MTEGDLGGFFLVTEGAAQMDIGSPGPLSHGLGMLIEAATETPRKRIA